MTERKFWKIIKKSRSPLAKSPEKHQSRLTRILRKKKVQEIIMFDCFFAHYMNISNTWELRAAATILNDKCDDEFFADFRGWLISRGRKTFYRILRNPEKLTKIVRVNDPMDWVGYGACALEAYERKTGKELPPPTAIKGMKWQEEDLPVKFPRLWKKYVN